MRDYLATFAAISFGWNESPKHGKLTRSLLIRPLSVRNIMQREITSPASRRANPRTREGATRRRRRAVKMKRQKRGVGDGQHGRDTSALLRLGAGRWRRVAEVNSRRGPLLHNVSLVSDQCRPALRLRSLKYKGRRVASFTVR